MCVRAHVLREGSERHSSRRRQEHGRRGGHSSGRGGAALVVQSGLSGIGLGGGGGRQIHLTFLPGDAGADADAAATFLLGVAGFGTRGFFSNDILAIPNADGFLYRV